MRKQLNLRMKELKGETLSIYGGLENIHITAILKMEIDQRSAINDMRIDNLKRFCNYK